MTKLVRQKTQDQCSIAAITMATGMPYNEVLKYARKNESYRDGIGSYPEQVFAAIGWRDETDYKKLYKAQDISVHYQLKMLWGRKAVLSVPSINHENGQHSIYWDGFELYDPQIKEMNRYTDVKQIKSLESIILINR
jgi:hypothetical protein